MTELEIQWNKSEIGSEIPKKCLFMAFQTKSQDLLDLRKMRRNISWMDRRTDGQTDRGKTVYPLPLWGAGV
jgi:hypothetical protein